MQALAGGRIPPPPIARLLGMWATKVDAGLVVFECTPDESVYNPIGMVHGGLLCTLADSAAGCAVHTTLDAGVGYSSIGINVNFLRPVTGGPAARRVGWSGAGGIPRPRIGSRNAEKAEMDRSSVSSRRHLRRLRDQFRPLLGGGREGRTRPHRRFRP